MLDVLLNMPMSEILKELPLEDAVVRALNYPKQDGKTGQLLSSVIDGGSGNFVEAVETLSRLGISPETHAHAQIAALNWAARINMAQ